MTIAVIAAVAVAIVVGTVVNITVPRNVFPSEVVNPSRSGNVIIPENASDPNGNSSFSPREITVVLGVNNTVIWENRSVSPERVIGADEGMPGGFDDVKGQIPSGGSWAFTFTEAGMYDYLSDIHPWLTGRVIVKGMDSGIKTEPELKPTVYYGFDNVGSNIPCIETEGPEAPMIKIYAENTKGPDAEVDFTLSARNANVSLDPSLGFKSASNNTIVVLEGTAYYPQTFYLRLVPNADYVSLTLDATPVSPTNTNLVWTLPFSNTVVFYKDQSGDYCREVHD